MTAPPYATWQLENVTTTSKGAKIAKVTSSSGAQYCRWRPSAALRAPFGLSSFDKVANPTRLNLDLVLDDPVVLREAEELDNWAVEYLVEHGERLFGRKMSEKQVSSSYVPCARPSKDQRYAPTLKVKANTNGPSAIRFWDAEGQPAEQPANWRDVKLNVLLTVSHAWFMKGDFGLTLLATDAMIIPNVSPPRECPFTSV